MSTFSIMHVVAAVAVLLTPGVTSKNIVSLIAGVYFKESNVKNDVNELAT